MINFIKISSFHLCIQYRINLPSSHGHFWAPNLMQKKLDEKKLDEKKLDEKKLDAKIINNEIQHLIH